MTLSIGKSVGKNGRTGLLPAAPVRALVPGKGDVARLQRIALAHMEAEQELEQLVSQGERPLTRAFALRAHEAMYARLSAQDRTTKDALVVGPRAIRDEHGD